MTTTRLTFAALCELEPGLARVAREIAAFTDAMHRKRNFCANGAWYGYGRFPRDFKQQLTTLVGAYRWGRHPDPAVQELLSGCPAYDVAYESLYRLLPNCRNCACL